MLVLDTDCTSLLQAQPPGEAAARLTARLIADGRPARPAIVTFEEQMRGRLAVCAAAKTPEQYAEAAHWLTRTLDFYRTRQLLPSDDRAAREFAALKAAKVRIGTQDLRIAAIALSLDVLLVTRNLRDFRRVPRLRAEDWTI